MSEQTAEANSYNAFISYASENREKAFNICDSLESKGLRCWIAPRDVRPGKEFPEEILRGLENSNCLVLLLSDAANSSPYVMREVERAVNYRKPIFPVRIEDVIPSPSLELLVSASHWVDAWSHNFLDQIEFLAKQLADSGNSELLVQSVGLNVPKKIWFWTLKNLSLLGLIIAVIFLGIIALPEKDSGQYKTSLYDIEEEDILVHITASSIYKKEALPSFFVTTTFNPDTVNPNLFDKLKLIFEVKVDQKYHVVESTSQSYYRLEYPSIPSLIKISILNENDEIIERFEYEPDFEGMYRGKYKEFVTKDEEKRRKRFLELKSRLINSQDGMLKCDQLLYGAISVCRFDVFGSEQALLTNVIDNIAFGSGGDDFNFYYSSNMPNQSNVGVLKSERGLQYVIPISKKRLNYSYTFTDGTNSGVKSLSKADKSVAISFQLKSLDSGAPSVYAVTDGRRLYNQARNKWAIIPITNFNVRAKAWSLFEGHYSEMDEKNNVRLIQDKLQSELQDPLSMNINGSSFISIYFESDGEVKKYKYSINFDEIFTSASIQSFNFEKATSCNKSGRKSGWTDMEKLNIPINSFGTTKVFVHCGASYGNIPSLNVVKNVFWGLKPNALSEFSEPDYSIVVEDFWNEILAKKVDIQKKLNELKLRGSGSKNLENQLLKLDEVIERKSDYTKLIEYDFKINNYSWYEGNKGYWFYYEAPSPHNIMLDELPKHLYFKYELIDGSSTGIYRVKVD